MVELIDPYLFFKFASGVDLYTDHTKQHYIEAYRRKLPEVFENVERTTFESTQGIEVINVSPRRISMPSFSEEFSIDILDVQLGKAWRISGRDWTEAQTYRE